MVTLDKRRVSLVVFLPPLSQTATRALNHHHHLFHLAAPSAHTPTIFIICDIQREEGFPSSP
jgi:hypothetical protein